MMYMQSLLGIILSAILTENFILVKFYGICPFMGVSKKIDTALGMGMAVTFVMALASAACYAVNLLLVKLGLDYMQTVAFILVIASIVQVVEMFLKKSVPALYKALGVFLPLITTNCAVLGVVLVNVQKGYNFLLSVVNGAAGGLGFTVAIVLFASIRERVNKADCPECFKGFPIALISAGLLALAFMGVSKKIDTALGMGMAVTFVMALASAACYLINLLLVMLGLEYMQTVAFILVIAALVQVVEMFLKKFVPALYQALGVFLPLITTNCAVLGVVLVNVQEGYNFLLSVVNGAAGGLGFTLAIVLFASVRERVDKTDCPECFKGFPIALIAAGLLALAFMGFSGLKIF